MARSDQLIKLVKAALSGDRAQVAKTAEALIAEARQKQHHSVANRLASALETTRLPDYLHQVNGNRRPERRTSPNGKALDYLADIPPRKHLNDLFLTDTCLELCTEVIEEQHRADLLRSHGLEPRHRILLAGPPGNGKTSLAEALAYEMNASFFVIRYETVIGSFLGETSSRLKNIFDYARTRPCVLFFDEFDTLGKERGDTHETGEIKRVVSSLLLQIDDLPSYTVVVSATNHPELLDKAVWRRFQIRIDLPQPTTKQLECYFAQYLRKFSEDVGYKPSTLAKYLYGNSYAEVEDFCLSIQRQQVLSTGNRTLKEIINSRLRHLKARFTV